VQLSAAQSNNNVVISWPLAPTGFELQSSTNITLATVWTTVTTPVTVDTNANRNVVVVPENGGNQFFQLQRP